MMLLLMMARYWTSTSTRLLLSWAITDLDQLHLFTAAAEVETNTGNGINS